MIDLKVGDYVRVTTLGEVTDTAVDHFELDGDVWFAQDAYTIVEVIPKVD